MTRRVLVVAGEISGDMHAAALVRELRARDPGLEFFGIGGDRLQAEGVALLHHVREMAVLGLSEVLRRYGFFRRVFGEVLAAARARRPDLVLLVDYPGFNLRLAARLHALGLKVVYYVCPQVWAWHRSRIPKMARILDRLLVIFPFEAELFRGTGLPVDFVGHPLVDDLRAALAEPLAELPWRGAPRLALLPGSRRQEIERILPVMAAAAARLEQAFPELAVLVAAPGAEAARCAGDVLAASGLRLRACAVVPGVTRQVLRQAGAALVASGTATLETALLGCPMAVVYKTAALTYALGRCLVRIPHIGMVNIVAGSAVCPEFIQGAARPAALADAVAPLLGDTPQRAAMREGLREVARALGEGGAARRAAELVLRELG